ncbi:MAG TPA: DUF5995 family protein [Thermoanaerobaculia bacterium]|nr:DUF5995 family protein [Thermoanaerobaculia bacterium]
MQQAAGGALQAQDIDQVLVMLAGIIARARSANSPMGFFPALYRQVTLAVRQGIARGLFDDGPRMQRLDTVFANRYLDAYQTFLGGGQPASCWDLAFRATRSDRLIILQDLLVAINAHINFDLGLAAAEICPGEAIASLHGDFDKINQLLGKLLPAAEAAIGRYSPLIGLLDQVGGRDETQVLDFSIDAAREDAWNHAVILAHLPQPVWPPAVAALDAKVTFLGKLIAEPGGLAGKAVEMIRLTESLDRAAVIDTLDSLDGADGAATAANGGGGPAGD